MDTVRGPSFPPLVRAAVSLLTLAVAAWGFAALEAWRGMPPPTQALLAAAAGVVLLGWVTVFFGVTEVTPSALRQRGLFWREARLADIRHARLVRLPGLDALFVPRLLVRTDGLGFRGFTAGNRALVSAFEALVFGSWPRPAGAKGP